MRADGILVSADGVAVTFDGDVLVELHEDGVVVVAVYHIPIRSWLSWSFDKV
jgi:hypothetical protein